MPRPYSDDLRERAIEEVRSGASRREVAEHFDVSPSSVINWLRRWCETGSTAAKPSGGSVSRLEKHAKWFLNLIAARPDLTLDEVVVAKNAAGIPVVAAPWGASSFATISASKKSLYAAEQQRADVARARRRWIREQGLLNPARL